MIGGRDGRTETTVDDLFPNFIVIKKGDNKEFMNTNIYFCCKATLHKQILL